MKYLKSNSFIIKLKKIATVLSWIVFSILIIISGVLVYYFISTKIYSIKGQGYEPAFSLYTIISPSMVPSIKVYDVVVDTKVGPAESIKVGDIITFDSTDFSIGKSISVTHRVIEVLVDPQGNYSYTTKGDNNVIKDAKPVPYNNITGKVLFKIPQLGRIQSFIASKFGWLLIIVIPALYIIIKDVLKILKVISPDDEKRTSILFMPIKRKTLYLPFHGYINENGEKEKFTISSLVPFTFDRDLVESKSKSKKTENIVNLEDIYHDLEEITKD